MTRQTSIDAYHKIEEDGTLSAQRWVVYDVLYHHGPMTANEVFKYIGDHSGYNAVTMRHFSNSIFTDMCLIGVIYEAGETKCSTSDHKVILWDVTSLDTPKKLPEREGRLRKLYAALKKYGRHLPSCLVERNGPLFRKSKCSCGFDVTVIELKPRSIKD